VELAVSEAVAIPAIVRALSSWRAEALPKHKHVPEVEKGFPIKGAKSPSQSQK
jgi:hypothetical protein